MQTCSIIWNYSSYYSRGAFLCKNSPRAKHNWHCTIGFLILFFCKEYILFSNVYISVNTIFECCYLFFCWEISHPLSMSTFVKSVLSYHNSSAAIRLLLSGEIESNLGPVNRAESSGNHKQNTSFPLFCQECNKTVKANSKRLLCIHWNNLVHLKFIATNATKSHTIRNDAYVIAAV